MAVGEANLDFNVVPGVRLAATAAGIKDHEKSVSALVLFEFAEGSATAGVFT